MGKLTIEWKKLNKDAIIPKTNLSGDACFDFFCVESGKIPPKSSKIISSGLSMQLKEDNKVMDKGWVLRAYPRSGLGFKHDIIIHIGTIDITYRGEIKIKLFNFSDKEFEFKKGDRLIQIAVEKVYDIEHVEVNELNDSIRNENGFGSSGN